MHILSLESLVNPIAIVYAQCGVSSFSDRSLVWLIFLKIYRRVSSPPEPPSHLPPDPIPLGYPGAPALGALLHALNLHWSSVLLKVDS